MGSLFKIFAICILPIVTCQYQFSQQQQQQQQQQIQPEQHDFLDIKSPEFFSFTPSPLQQPDSLRSRPYFDFLSTLYRHDQGKSSLFTQYPKSKREARFLQEDTANDEIDHDIEFHRQRRDAVLSPVLDALQSDAVAPIENRIVKRAVVFRPLFVYRQQQVQKQKQEERRRY